MSDAGLPPPLVPADVDLTDFPFMPLDVRRIRDSRLAATLSGDEFMAWMMLLCASWHQKPAGSLPEDEIELALLAGFGRVIKEWRKVAKGALYGWVRCSDGRLYHTVVAGKALEAWDGKLRHEHGKLCERMRKENKRRAESGQPVAETPTFEAWKASRNSGAVPAEKTIVPPERPRNSEDRPAEHAGDDSGNPAENRLIGTGTNTTAADAFARTHEDDQHPDPAGTRWPDEYVPQSPGEWEDFFVREYGFQMHEVLTPKSVPMFREWCALAITAGEARDAVRIADTRNNGPPAYVTYYDGPVRDVRREAERRSRGDTNTKRGGHERTQTHTRPSAADRVRQANGLGEFSGTVFDAEWVDQA